MAGKLLAATTTQAALLVSERFDQREDDVPLNGLNGLDASAKDLTGMWAVKDTAIVHRG